MKWQWFGNNGLLFNCLILIMVTMTCIMVALIIGNYPNFGFADQILTLQIHITFWIKWGSFCLYIAYLNDKLDLYFLSKGLFPDKGYVQGPRALNDSRHKKLKDDTYVQIYMNRYRKSLKALVFFVPIDILYTFAAVLLV